MSRPSEEYPTDSALRRGLRGLPVPEVSAGFDARVRAALRRPPPWWQSLWTAARPALSTAACSLAVTLLLLPWLTRMPAAAPDLRRHAAPDIIASNRHGERMDNLDQGLERMDLSTASLIGLTPRRSPAKQTPIQPALRHADPERRSQLATPPAA